VAAKDQYRKTAPLRIGLTGGIASGKTAVANMFAEMGAAIIDTDLIARAIVQPGEPALEQLRQEFGDQIIQVSGDLDRAALRQIVFSDVEKRIKLEQILHPLIQQETIRQAEFATGDYQLIVVPLLVESPLRDFVDRILVVDCAEATQVKRLISRDSESEAQARRILAAQASREERVAIADDIVRNDGSLAETRQQVENLHTIYRQLSQHGDSHAS
jgi:dephospho-CoA kinase